MIDEEFQNSHSSSTVQKKIFFILPSSLKNDRAQKVIFKLARSKRKSSVSKMTDVFSGYNWLICALVVEACYK